MIKPIHFQGLHCYHDCVISVANDFGIHYPDAFAPLWSETDFRYDPYREAYLTKRMISSLEALGVKIENLPFLSRSDKDEALSLLQDGDYIIAGMDAFYITWSSFYETFHGYHYFIARYERRGVLVCDDPTYKKQDESILRDTIIAKTFDLIRVSRCEANPPRTEPAREAREILQTHEQTRSSLLSRIRGCVNEEQHTVALTAKYMDAMMNNRYLYRYFLESQTPDYSGLFRDDSLFRKWKAVKNGLYKAAVNRDNAHVVDAVCGCFNELIDEELAVAEKIIHG